MALPDKDSIATFGGSRTNATAKVNSRTDVGAEDTNPLFNDVAMLSVLGWRVWAAFHWTSGTSLVLDANDEMWNGSPSYTAPTLAYAVAGKYMITYPTTVNDFITSGDPGYVGVHTVSLRAGRGAARNQTGTLLLVDVVATSGNVLTVTVKNTSNALVDTAGMVLDVWGM